MAWIFMSPWNSCWNSKSQRMIVKEVRVLGGGWSSHEWVSAFIKEAPERSLVPPSMWGHKKMLWTRKKTFTRMWPCRHLDLGFPSLWDCEQEEKGPTEDEVVGWHHWLSGHEFEQALGDGEGQGRLACCSPWVAKSQIGLSNWTTRNRSVIALQKDSSTDEHVHCIFKNLTCIL